MDAVTVECGLIALIGAAGVGKSLLLADLHRRLHEAGQAAEFLYFGDLVSGDEPPGLLLVDEADRIDQQGLERLAQRASGAAVLAALPSFVNRLSDLPHRIVRFGGLRGEDIDLYVASRLEAQGVASLAFEPDAMDALGLESAGIPRLLNVLIGASQFAAQLEGSQIVTAEHVRSAAGMHALPVSALRATRPQAAARPRPPAPNPPAPNPPAPNPPGPHVKPEFAPEFVAEPAPQPRLVEPAPLPVQSETRIGVTSRESRREARIWPWVLALLLLAGGAAAWFGRDFVPPADLPWVLTTTPSPPDVRPADAPVEPSRPGELAAPGAAPSPAAPGDGAETASSAPTIESPANPAPAPAVVVAPDPPIQSSANDNAGQALPDRPTARLVVTYPRGDSAAAARGTILAAALRGGGTRVSAPFPVAGGGGEALRYFFLEDRDLAASVAERAGGAAVLARLGTVSDQAPLPRPGTLEWALPAGATPTQSAAPPPAPWSAATAAAPGAPEPLQPADGERITEFDAPRQVLLRWTRPERTGQPCCFVEVMRRSTGSAWREVFSGYATQNDRQLVPIGEAGRYAWRVLAVTREGPRYVAGPWSGFVVPAAP